MDLFTRYKLGDLELSNRMVMAPMTRCRALSGNVPNPLAVTYYVQRASAGLIVTEGSQVSPQGVGYARTPGIHSPGQVAGWKKVTRFTGQAGKFSSSSGMWDVCRIPISWVVNCRSHLLHFLSRATFILHLAKRKSKRHALSGSMRY